MARSVTAPEVLDFVQGHPDFSSKEIHTGLGTDAGYATLKRTLKDLVKKGHLATSGKGKSTRYKLSAGFEILAPVDLDEYFKKEIDERSIKQTFNHDLIGTLRNVSLFDADELNELHALQQKYERKSKELSAQQYRQELERLAIDLSWKSSQIEGNTYSLLETERLLKEKETAEGKTRDEATMLLNHKEALDFIIENPDHIMPLSVARIEEIHSMLIKDLGVERNIRSRRVGVTGTNYRPLENEFQIREALEAMCDLIRVQENVFSKALLGLVLLSYIQAFNDGNKRTARIISNAILINSHYCPLSFRTIDPITYKKAMLLFYEQNNITAFKKLFIEQVRFAVETYF
ncbi:MAG: Fic family protein [Bacteroidota bacterium]|nr:Fic family protein [Bacteroidota bacterium]